MIELLKLPESNSKAAKFEVLFEHVSQSRLFPPSGSLASTSSPSPSLSPPSTSSPSCSVYRPLTKMLQPRRHAVWSDSLPTSTNDATSFPLKRASGLSKTPGPSKKPQMGLGGTVGKGKVAMTTGLRGKGRVMSKENTVGFKEQQKEGKGKGKGLEEIGSSLFCQPLVLNDILSVAAANRTSTPLQRSPPPSPDGPAKRPPPRQDQHLQETLFVFPRLRFPRSNRNEPQILPATSQNSRRRSRNQEDRPTRTANPRRRAGERQGQGTGRR